MSDSSTEQKIRDMAKLSMFENKLNDIQLKNIRSFPLVFFNGVKAATVEYDFHMDKPVVEYEKDERNVDIKYKFNPVKHNSRVTYYLEIDESKENPLIEKRFAVLESSIRNIFWKNVKVQVYINNQLAYESKDV